MWYFLESNQRTKKRWLENWYFPLFSFYFPILHLSIICFLTFEMAQRQSLPFLTKERRPWLLSIRSSQSFIITTVSLSMFTVSSLGPDSFLRNDQTKVTIGPLSLHNGMNFHGVMDTGLCLKVIDRTHHAQRIGFPGRCQF